MRSVGPASGEPPASGAQACGEVLAVLVAGAVGAAVGAGVVGAGVAVRVGAAVAGTAVLGAVVGAGDTCTVSGVHAIATTEVSAKSAVARRIRIVTGPAVSHCGCAVASIVEMHDRDPSASIVPNDQLVPLAHSKV